MAIYVYRKALSSGARELAEKLGGKRFRGRVRPIAEVLRPGDTVICWGEALAAPLGVKVINGTPIMNKLSDATKLKAAGVATIMASQQKPAPALQGVDDPGSKPLWIEAVEAAEEFIEIPYGGRQPVFLQGLKEFHVILTKLEQQLAVPLAPKEAWIPRVYNHVGGTDLLNPPAQPDYWVRKEKLVEEIRIHSFNGKSIRAGQKVQRPGAIPHDWVRSYDGGWSIVYDGFDSKKEQRELAHEAVKALGLTFGAVDLGKREDGKWMVLEVNRAPGLENNTITIYARAIQEWMNNPAPAQPRV